MHSTTRSILIALAAILALAAAPAALAADTTANAAKAAKHRMVMQVSDGDPARWNLAFNNLKNVQAELGRDNVELELVAYGPGISMLAMDSPVGERVSEAVRNGIRVVACENTMHGRKLSRADMLPAIGYVRAGVVELIDRQQEGYAYIRP